MAALLGGVGAFAARLQQVRNGIPRALKERPKRRRKSLSNVATIYRAHDE